MVSAYRINATRMLDPAPLCDLAPELNYVLNQWDPIGVADLVDNEYLCLVGPLLRRLSAGQGPAELSEFLWHELEDRTASPRALDPSRR